MAPDRPLRLLGWRVFAAFALVLVAAQADQPDNAQQASDVVRQMLKSGDTATRMAALDAFRQTSAPAAVYACLNALADPDLAVRRRAVEVLNTVDKDIATDQALTVLGLNSPLSEAVATALPGLRPLLETPCMDVLGKSSIPLGRYLCAIFALGRMQSHRATPLLAQIAAQTTDPNVARYVAWALVDSNDPAALPHLVELGARSDPSMQAAAVDGLTRYKSLATATTLARLLSTAPAMDADVMQRGIDVLTQWRYPPTIPYVVTLMDQNAHARAAALAALRTMTGQSFSDNPAAWRQWYDAQYGPPQDTSSYIQYPTLPTEELFGSDPEALRKLQRDMMGP